MTVKCPTCKKEIQYSTENKFRPFCSERCKIIDLGAWANQDYKIEGKELANFDGDDAQQNEHNDEQES